MLGVLVIGVTLMVMAVVSHLSPKAVRGTAVAVPVAGAPAVGDCVLDPGSSPWILQDATPAPTSNISLPYPTLQIGSCVATRYGEVVAIIADPARPVVTTNADGSGSIVDPNMETCQPAALRYIGLPVSGRGYQADFFTFWNPTAALGAAGSAPSVRQRAAGQHWLACVTYPQPGSHGMIDPPASYESSLRGAMLTGAHRDELGTCLLVADPVQNQNIDCTELHQGELFGYAYTGERHVSRAELERTCRQVIAQLTRLPDITAGGDLTVQLLVFDSNRAPVTAAQEPANAFAFCGLNTTGSRQLRASLLARGRGPLPWA